MAEDKSLIRSYVQHDGQWFYVSTIDRDSSAMRGPRRFAETIVWRFDFEKDERGELIDMGSGGEGSIYSHLEICKLLHTSGEQGLKDKE